MDKCSVSRNILCSDTNQNIKKAGNISSVGPSRKVNSWNAKRYYPYLQYTNFVIYFH